MAQNKGGGGKPSARSTSDRKCGKASKKRPGEPKSRNNGKTRGGYSEAAQKRRQSRRGIKAASNG